MFLYPLAYRNRSHGQWLRHFRPSAPFQHHHHQTSMIKMDRPSKRPKISSFEHRPSTTDPAHCDTLTAENNGLASLRRSITPPPPPRRQEPTNTTAVSDGVKATESPFHKKIPTTTHPSPIQLTHVRDLPASSGNNVDTVRLRDILKNPMIRECWQFNFLIDVDFLMSQFDEDVRDLVKVKVVHGSWKKDAPNRIRIDVVSPLFLDWNAFPNGVIGTMLEVS